MCLVQDAIHLNVYCFTSAQLCLKTWTPQTLFLKTYTGGSYKMNAEYPQLRLSQSRKRETLGRVTDTEDGHTYHVRKVADQIAILRR